MVKLNKNFVIFLILFALSFFLPKFLLIFRMKLLFMLLIIFLILSSKIKLHISAFLGHLQNITTFAPLVFLVLFFFNHMNITNLNLSLGLNFVVFLVMMKLKRGISVMILSLIVLISFAMLSFGDIAPLSSSLTSVPPYLRPLS